MESDTDHEQLECLDGFVDFLSRFGFGPKGRTEVGNMEVVGTVSKGSIKIQQRFCLFSGEISIQG